MTKKIATEHNLQISNPTLAKEWHPTKNGGLTPKDVAVKSNKKVWWLCSRGHEYESRVADRDNGKGCPFCVGKKVNEENCLQTVNPTLAKEWHPTRNGELTPKKVTAGSHRKVWWLCSRDHEWEATVYHRSNGKGCPYCHSKTSKLELRVFTEMKYLFPDAEHRKQIHKVECDVFLPSLNLAIEIDGVYYHKNKYEQDKIKTNVLKKENVDLIRIREKGLSKVSSNDILCKTNKIDFDLFRSLILQILRLRSIDYDVRKRIKDYLTKSKFANDEEFKKIWNMLPSPFPELSLQMLNPALAKEWHPTKNGNLKPIDVTISSNKKVWWLCSRGHEYEAVINNRSKGSGCPYCAGNKVNEENCLQTLNPALAKEWHPTKNGELTPKKVTVHSSKKVWWLCSRGHEYEAVVYSRSSGNGCPFCVNRKVNNENCLQTLNPALAKEWHPTKNNKLTPMDVTAGTETKVWWLCSRGHEYESRVADRNNGKGCPFCVGKKVNEENCLQTVNPTLAKEWHPTKNGKLTPKKVTAHSGKKVWWLCSRGHEYDATVANRSNGRGCPHCYRQRLG